MSRPALLADLTWTEVAALAGSSVLAVPVGSTEQHGPHLPLSTDCDIASALCARLAEARRDVLVAPALAYGSSGEHAGFAGTLSIGADATEAVLVELGRSADAFAGVLFVSAHGGNAGPVGRAACLLSSESRNVRAWCLPDATLPTATLPATKLPDSGLPAGGGVSGGGVSGGGVSGWVSDAHAGFVETSVLLALAPASVRTASAAAGPVTPVHELMPALRRGGVASVSANGVLGDPTGASPHAGAVILDAWAANLVAELQGWPR